MRQLACERTASDTRYKGLKDNNYVARILWAYSDFAEDPGSGSIPARDKRILSVIYAQEVALCGFYVDIFALL
jgi:hypothetical protein